MKQTIVKTVLTIGLLTNITLAPSAHSVEVIGYSALGLTVSALADSDALDPAASTFGYKMIIADAKDDALLFVASDGEFLGARLENALTMLREYDSNLSSMSDTELANIIIAQ